MKERTIWPFSCKLRFVLFYLAILSLAAPNIALAAEQGIKSVVAEVTLKKRTPLVMSSFQEEGDSQERRKSFVASGSLYEVINETEVFLGEKGTRILIDDLPVPCKAKIVYQPLRKNRRNALQVYVLKVYSGASASWPENQPQ